MDTTTFSPDLMKDLALALQEYATTASSIDSTQGQALTDRICTEAHARGIAPERMVKAFKAFSDGLSRGDAAAEQRRQMALDRLLAGCIRAYYAADKKSAS